MDGSVIRQFCPALVDLTERIGEVVRNTTGLELVPMNNGTANLNVNITPPSGEYRWHYDRNIVTAILYLNSVAGGETEIYPNYRVHLGRWSATRLQRILDGFLRLSAMRQAFGKGEIIAPRAGLLVIMLGSRSLHSVRRVEGSEDRISVVMSFDDPRMCSAQLTDLDEYLYSREPVRSSDPNYRK
jgi:hypothetical protein